MARAFGRLAYVWRGHLYVLQESGVRQITFQGFAANPVWAPDGRSLTYQLATSSSAGVSQTWSVRADGSGAHRITGSGCPPCPSPDGRRRVIVEQGVVPPRTHSGPAAQRFPSIAVAGAATGRIVRRYRVPAPRGALILFLGWWPDGRAILFQVDPYASASIAADGLMLYSLTLADGRVHRLTTALAYRDFVAIRGTHALVVAGSVRSIYFNKRLVLCDETGGCRTIAGGSRTVALDPAWSPSGRAIAWVEAPAHPGVYGYDSARAYHRLDGARTLWEALPDGSQATPVPALGGGIADPQWTRDGRGLLFIKDNAIWFDAHLGVSDLERLASLFPPGQPPRFGGYWDDLFYYGHIQWEYLFAWWQPPLPAPG